MPLDPRAQAFIDQMAAMGIGFSPDLTPAVAREMAKSYRANLAAQSPKEPVARVDDWHIPGPAGDLPIRVYTPKGSGPFPILLYFHTGGWVVGDLDAQDPLCRRLANLVECLVISVQYRLAPEHPFPAAPEDCYAATRWAVANAAEIQGDPSRIAVGGDSCGGNMATVVALMARDRGGPALVFQLLICPATDFRLNTPSMETYGEGYFLTKRQMIWLKDHYLSSPADATHPLASPLLAENLSGLPPALIITAEYDPVRDEGEAYGKRLQEAGVRATISRYDGQLHDFVDMFDWGDQALAESVAALRAAFGEADT